MCCNMKDPGVGSESLERRLRSAGVRQFDRTSPPRPGPRFVPDRGGLIDFELCARKRLKTLRAKRVAVGDLTAERRGPGRGDECRDIVRRAIEVWRSDGEEIRPAQPRIGGSGNVPLRRE